MELRKIEFKSNKKGLVDICIPIYKRLEFTKYVFKSLLKRTDFDLIEKIIIINDIPDEESTKFLEKQIEELKKFKIGVVYIETKNKSVAAGMKKGMELSAAKYFLKIDNDVIPGEHWVNHLVDCMESYPELVVLGYGKIWEDDFPKEKIVMKNSLDYGYLKCFDNSKKTTSYKYSKEFVKQLDVYPHYLRVHVGGLVIIRMEKIRPTLEKFIVRGKFLGWGEYQINYVEPRGTVGWYYPNIKGTLILDNLKDRTAFEKADLNYDELCSLTKKYYKNQWSKHDLNVALISNQRVRLLKEKGD